MSIGKTDQEIIQQVLQGDQSAYGEMISRYQHYVFTLAFRLVQNREDAEEIAQDVFVKAYRSLADFKGGSKFSTWLYTIAHNTGVTFLRKKRIQTFSIDDEKHAAHLSDMRSAFSADQTEAKSRKDALNKAIGLLSAEDATIITLFYQAEMNLAEVGKVLSADVNTVKVRLFRARQKLKLILEEKFADEMLQTHGT